MPSFNDSSPSDLDNQQVYRELIIHLSQFFSEETITERLNVEQMFILVDGVLPIEACLYYQVLPLFLDGSRLHLGMVDPSDTTASDYVRRIVSYLNYSLITRRISSPALQAALSAYLKYSDSQSSKTTPASSSVPTNDEQTASGSITHNIETNSKETLVLDSSVVLPQDEILAELQTSQRASSAPILPSDELTCIDPEETEIIQVRDQGSFGQVPEDDILLSPVDPANTAKDGQWDGSSPVLANEGGTDDIEATWVVDERPETANNLEERNPPTTSAAASPSSAPVEAEASPESVNSTQPGSDTSSADPLAVRIEAKHLEQRINHLQDLPPRDLLRELLVRAMSGGIGRLYFERKDEYGRILWSQSGVLQSAVDNIPSVKFQALINEFKRLTRLPLLPLRKTKQVELERFYNGNRVLLRFRFIPGQYGEQATLQVLRGVALNFYQQQQVKRVGQDALSIAKQLQLKVNELRSRIEAYPRASTLEQTSLPELKTMLMQLEQQVESLETEASDPSNQSEVKHSEGKV